MKISVESVDNGGIITFRTDYGENSRTVYEFGPGDVNGLAEMLYGVMDILGLSGDRYDEMRVVVRVVHGDKFQHPEGKVCDICVVGDA